MIKYEYEFYEPCNLYPVFMREKLFKFPQYLLTLKYLKFHGVLFWGKILYRLKHFSPKLIEEKINMNND